MCPGEAVPEAGSVRAEHEEYVDVERRYGRYAGP